MALGIYIYFLEGKPIPDMTPSQKGIKIFSRKISYLLLEGDSWGSMVDKGRSTPDTLLAARPS